MLNPGAAYFLSKRKASINAGMVHEHPTQALLDNSERSEESTVIGLHLRVFV
jgi:aspartate carbamoyltransferase catalytic subunit